MKGRPGASTTSRLPGLLACALLVAGCLPPRYAVASRTSYSAPFPWLPLGSNYPPQSACEFWEDTGRKGAMILVQSSGAVLRDSSCHPVEADSASYAEPGPVFEVTAPSRIEGAIRRRITLISPSAGAGSFQVGTATSSAGILEYAELLGGPAGLDFVAVWAASGSIGLSTVEDDSGAYGELQGSALTFSPASLPNARYSGENMAQGSFVADVAIRLGY